MTSGPPRLEFRQVRKHYDSGGEIVRAADEVSLVVEAGEVAAVFGPSGSGKSTLLNIAAGVLAPDAGAVLVDGIDVTRLTGAEADDYRLRMLGWIKQDAHLITGDALDNAALKLLPLTRNRAEARRQVTPLLQRLGLAERLTQRAEKLSTGERQRVMIARALAVDPSVILADEPTGNLDSKRSREVLALLRDETRARGIATVLVTHDEHASAYADNTYILTDGALQTVDADAVIER
jgi:putative ABC transport system ATP-binding protein